MPKPRRIHQPEFPVFITAVTRSRQPWIRPTHRKLTLIASMHRVRQTLRFRQYGHVILDDHVHWLVHPTVESDVSRIVAAFKRDVTWRLKRQGIPEEPWQPRFYDHVIRDAQDFKRHLDYIHFNPVRHGYVRVASDFRFSSLSEWQRRGVYPQFWGVGSGPKALESMNLE